ncbi:MAG: PH domain-containing protein [Jatrophihabitantaceae bacterium]
MSAVSAADLTAQPIRTSRIAWACSAVILAVFIVTALVMRTDNAGAHLNGTDQVGTVIIGIILAGLAIMPTRPRLRADADGVHLRSFLGGWRDVPWELVVRIDFPSKVRFARIVLPGEETLAIYAVQRWDRGYAVDKMRRLRVLHAAHHQSVS